MRDFCLMFDFILKHDKYINESKDFNTCLHDVISSMNVPLITTYINYILNNECAYIEYKTKKISIEYMINQTNKLFMTLDSPLKNSQHFSRKEWLSLLSKVKTIAGRFSSPLTFDQMDMDLTKAEFDTYYVGSKIPPSRFENIQQGDVIQVKISHANGKRNSYQNVTITKVNTSDKQCYA